MMASGGLNHDSSRARSQDGAGGDRDGGTQSNQDGQGFRCITCNRGPPYTKKYAKNQCQTCYKKDKKF